MNANNNNNNTNLPNHAAIMVGGEPIVGADKHGNAVFNKMKKIDENFDEIQYLVIIFNSEIF